MGHNLYREVKRGAPRSWDPTMRLVALVIADEASDETRRTIGYQIEGYWRPHGKGWRDGLTEHTGLRPDGVTKALRRLAAAGYDMRVPVGQDQAGRPVFAYRGHATDYQVPPLPPRDLPPQPERVADSPPIQRERVASRPLMAGPQATPFPQVTSEELSPHTADAGSPAGDRAKPIPTTSGTADAEPDPLEDLERVEQAVEGELGTEEESVAQGMLMGGSPVAAVVNKIEADRRRPQMEDLMRRGLMLGEAAEALGISLDAATRDVCAVFGLDVRRSLSLSQATRARARLPVHLRYPPPAPDPWAASPGREGR